jgi:GH15 family glucan-1,4-alpha-glucosidase
VNRLIGPTSPAGVARSPARTDGYAPIKDYAAIGDGRTIALVAVDGSIDWLCLPNLDSRSVFAAMLDTERGGSFRVAPVVPFTVERRYIPGTNVLETTFRTDEGTVRVTDAMVLPLAGLAPARELVRDIKGISGRVPLRWRIEPRFDYGEARTLIRRSGAVPVISGGGEAVAICSWSAGEPRCDSTSIEARFAIEAGERALIALSAADGDPLVFPSRDEIDTRLQATTGFWREWSDGRRYDGPWREAVLRSALALKLLIHSPSGAIAAAATSSLPEVIGGERNWDYRFSWIRDAAFTLDALLRLGCPTEAEAFFWWLLHASQLTHPRLHVLYRLDGGTRVTERELEMDGYRRSRPARLGNKAAAQLQLDIYGHLMQTAWLYARAGGAMPSDAARRLARTADLVCSSWRVPDSGIWEVRSPPQHFTESKMMCWTALDRAVKLAGDGHIPNGDAGRWVAEREAIGRFIEERCWSRKSGGYSRHADGSEADAAVLIGFLMGYEGRGGRRLDATIDRIRRDLGRGPLLYRYLGEDGLSGREGAFVACSFWLVDALARAGHPEEAAELMDELVSLANDVGLYAEEIDPDTGTFLGNFPQGLVHLGLINAAVTLQEIAGR